MAQTGGPEAAVAALSSMLRSNLTSSLDARWVAAADSVPKPYPNAWTPNIQQFNRLLVQEFPSLMVSCDSGVMTDDAAPVWAEVRHMLVVKAWIQGDDAGVADQQALRFLWALWMCIQEHQAGVQAPLSNFVSAVPQRWTRVTQEDSDVVRCMALQVVVTLLENA